MPSSPVDSSRLQIDYELERLSSLLIDITHANVKEGQRLTLKDLAIGALTYGHVMMGVNRYPMHKTSNCLQLRIYHIEHGYTPHGQKVLKPRLIAKGTPADAHGIAENLDIFDVYWLDGAPLKLNTQVTYRRQ